MSTKSSAIVLYLTCLSALSSAFQPILRDEERGLVHYPLRDGSTFPVYQRGDPEMLKTDRRKHRRELRGRDKNNRKGKPSSITEVCNGTFLKHNLCLESSKGREFQLATVDEFECVATSVKKGSTLYLAQGPCRAGAKARKSKVRDGMQKEALDPIPFNTALACSTLPEGCQFTPEKIPSHLVAKFHNFEDNVMHGQRYRRLVGREYMAPRIRSIPDTISFWDHDETDAMAVPSRATHFQSLPSEYERISDPNNFAGSHRSLEEDLTLKLQVASIEPRVFEVSDFVSEIEANFLLDVANENELNRAKEDLFVLSVLYERVLDLLRIGEENNPVDLGLVMDVSVDRFENLDEIEGHDRVVDESERERFAQVIVFLTDAPGHVVFPQHGTEDDDFVVAVEAQKGKAVLLYSMLPDGNLDEYAVPTILPESDDDVWIATITVKDAILDKTTK